MTALSIDRLRVMLGREGNRAEAAERRVRDQAAEIARLRARIAALESGPGAKGLGTIETPS